jgi:hypothetical protein
VQRARVGRAPPGTGGRAIVGRGGAGAHRPIIGRRGRRYKPAGRAMEPVSPITDTPPM